MYAVKEKGPEIVRGLRIISEFHDQPTLYGSAFPIHIVFIFLGPPAMAPPINPQVASVQQVPPGSSSPGQAEQKQPEKVGRTATETVRDDTIKILKSWTPEINTFTDLKIWIYKADMHLKDADGTTNSVDPDQTAPKEQSDLGLHCLRKPTCI